MTPRTPISLGQTLAIIAFALLRSAPACAVGSALDHPPLRIGFDGAYKLGCWTPIDAEMAIDIQVEDETGTFEITASDSDGVPCTYSAPAAVVVTKEFGSLATGTAFIRVGQEYAPLVVRFLDTQGRLRGTRQLLPSSQSTGDVFPTGLPATSRLIVSVGSREDLAAPLARADETTSPAEALHTVLLRDLTSLPPAWQGYESADAVILSAAFPKLFDPDRAATAPRVAALAHWVELGGRLVVFCGAANADMMAADGPLAPLVPGRFAGELVPLQDFTPLEVFSGAGVAVTRANAARFRVPRLVDVTGRILAQGPGELPLVVRSRRGLGDITFIAADLEAPPFNSWSERTALVRQALQWPAPANTAGSVRRTTGVAIADMSNQLRSALDQKFVGVTATPFVWLAGLVLIYVALIGPGDYFLLHRLRRMQWTWITFPLVAVFVCGAAYALAHRVKGNVLRVNQVEIVDVDVDARQARGTVITHLFNPRVARFDLTLEPRFAGKTVEQRQDAGDAQNQTRAEASSASSLKPQGSSLKPSRLVAWLGVPGQGLGAMQGQRGQLAPFDRGYEINAKLERIDDLPVEQWSTKSLMARWTGDVGPTIDAQLHPRGDNELEGRVTNRTGVRLEDCVLVRGNWAYKLPPLDDGAEAVVDDALPNVSIRTMLTSVAAGEDSSVRHADDGSVPFDPLSTDVARILKVMMFYDALGGAKYAGTPNRYLSFLDMSRLIRGDQAVLLARTPAAAGSHWIDGDQPWINPDDRRWVYYRFVIPLAEEEQVPEGPMLGPPAAPRG